jgi:hypothetical protein
MGTHEHSLDLAALRAKRLDPPRPAGTPFSRKTKKETESAISFSAPNRLRIARA